MAMIREGQSAEGCNVRGARRSRRFNVRVNKGLRIFAEPLEVAKRLECGVFHRRFRWSARGGCGLAIGPTGNTNYENSLVKRTRP